MPGEEDVLLRHRAHPPSGAAQPILAPGVMEHGRVCWWHHSEMIEGGKSPVLDPLDGNPSPSARAQQPREVTSIGDSQMSLIHYHLKSFLLYPNKFEMK